jgi:hypothetical protein
MTDQAKLADILIKSYGLSILPEDHDALHKTLGEILTAAGTVKKDRAMTDEPAAIFKLRPAPRKA